MKLLLCLIISFIFFIKLNAQNFLAERFSYKYDTTKIIKRLDFSPELAKYFLNLASYGNCSEDLMNQKLCCNKFLTQEKWELIQAGTIEFAQYNYSILMNKNSKKFVFAFPGTRGIPQFMKEVYHQGGVVYDEESSGKIMGYFQSIYTQLKDNLRKFTKELVDKYHEYQFIFVGHSLGASMATIAIHDLIKSKIIPVTVSEPVLITYGQPRTGNDIFSNEVMKYVPIIFRVVRQGDFIASFPTCDSGYCDSTCNTILKDGKFNRDIIVSPEQKVLENDSYYKWHIGGLRLFDYEMENFVDCGLEYGDNNPDSQCKIEVGYSIHTHVEYFGMWISRYCPSNPE